MRDHGTSRRRLSPMGMASPVPFVQFHDAMPWMTYRTPSSAAIFSTGLPAAIAMHVVTAMPPSKGSDGYRYATSPSSWVWFGQAQSVRTSTSSLTAAPFSR